MSERKPRVWALRLVQAFPLAVLALLAAVWFTVPADTSTGLLAFREGDGPTTPTMRLNWLESEEQLEKAAEEDLFGTSPDSLNVVLSASWERWIDALPAVISGPDVKSPDLSLVQGAFEGVAEWEKQHGARVWAWIALGPPMPPVAARAIGDPASLAAAQGQFKAAQQDSREQGLDPYGSLEEYLWQEGRREGLPTLEPSILEEQNGSAMGGGGYSTAYSSVVEAGRVWRLVVISEELDPEDPPRAEPEGLRSVSPRSPRYAEHLRRVARQEKANILVFGPLELDTVTLRAPEGADLTRTAEIADEVWPKMALTGPLRMAPPVVELSPRARALTGNTHGSLYSLSRFNSEIYGAQVYDAEEVAPPTVAYLVTFDRSTAKPPLSERLARAWKRLVWAWFPWLIGGLLGVLALSLVAAPSSFVYERRRAARFRVQEELAYMHRDAHDKVYNRLAALSKRVATAGDELSATNSMKLEAIAEDIRATVGELQQILGDEVRHTNSALTSQPVAAQIERVCKAQAARLQVDVVCRSGHELPDVSAQLGWDLQCIAEEAITNAVRHGAAAHIRVSLFEPEPGILVLEVVDDGRGSDVTSPDAAPPGSSGWRSIRERVARRGGSVGISTAATGLTLTARVPVELEDAPVDLV